MDTNEINIIEEYARTSYVEANTLLAARFNTETGTLPTLNQIKARRWFDQGEHWQQGDGFIGQLPTGDAYEERTELLRKAFSPEDVISEVLDTHVENVLGDEPAISLESDGREGPAMSEAQLMDTLEAVKEWYDKRQGSKVLAAALRGARRESASVLRAFIPAGLIDGEGRIQAKDLREALSKIWIRAEKIEDGGVIVDEATATELGLFRYRMKIGKADVSLCEYAYLDAEGRTVWGTASAHNQSLGTEVAEPLMLGGMLPMYQMDAKALITESVCQAQRDINLSGTMLTRNNNLAGSRERLAIGVQPPGEWTDSTDPDTGAVTRTFTPAEMKTGPATFNFLSAMPNVDEDGKITGFGNPNVIFTDPVPIDTFLGTSSHWRTVIYSKARMRHLLMADDATASGRSRIEARKEFQASLNESKQIVDEAGRWMVEVALNIAAHFVGAPGAYLGVMAKFDARISTIDLTPQEIEQIRSDFEAGLIDHRTALELRGYKNVDEIIERVRDADDPTPTDPINGPVNDARRMTANG